MVLLRVDPITISKLHQPHPPARTVLAKLGTSERVKGLASWKKDFWRFKGLSGYWLHYKMKRTLSACSSSSDTVPAKKAKKMATGFGHWSMKLKDAMEDPEKVLKSDELTVTIKDAYPKARHHFLVLSKADLPHMRSLNGSHVDLLVKMLDNGKAIADEVRAKCQSEVEKPVFRYGYHASPSMSRLHMHVISQDFNSPCLKHKKHWNSFTSDFFLDAEKVIGILKDKGKVDLDVKRVYEPMLSLPLKCHVCRKILQNMPKLKEHLRTHFK